MLFVACAGNEPDEGDDSGLGEDASVPGETTGHHLLVSGQMVLANEDALGAYEMDDDGTVTWSAPLATGTGGFGAVRTEGKETLIAWTKMGENLSSGLLRLDGEGNTLRRYDGGDTAAPSFPHGVGALAGGNIVVGDGWNGDIICIDQDGNLVWRMSTPEFGYGQVPSGLRVFLVEERPLLVATLLGEGGLESGERFDQTLAWWIDGAEPQFAWAFPPEPDSSLSLWVHGPQQTADGTLLISSAGLGQVIHLDINGVEIERVPPTADPYRFAFPRDAVQLPGGDLLVLDATELLAVHDPFGDYSVEPVGELLFGYSLDLLDCSAGACIGGR